MSATFVEDLCQLDVTELRQLIVALCLDPKTKEFATQHLDMTAHMKSIKAQEAQVSDEESITDYDSEPSEKGDLDCWGSPPPNDSDSDAEDTPCSSENHTWEARANYSDPWAEENKSTCSLGPNSVEDVDWGFAPEPGFWFPACQRDNTLGSDDSPERSASESAWNVDSGSDFSRNVWCADCDQEFIPTSKWYDEFYGERMPCRFHTGRLPTPEYSRVRLFPCLMRVY